MDKYKRFIIYSDINIHHKLRNYSFRYDINTQQRELTRMNSQLEKLKDIDQRKMSKLKELGPQIYEVRFWGKILFKGFLNRL